MNFVSVTCKRNWAIECSELEAALMESFHQMGVNSWKGKTAGRNTRDPRPWDKLLTKEIETAGKCQICSSFKEDRQLLTTVVQRTEWLPKKSKGYEPWNIDGISKTDPLLSAALAGNCAVSGISPDAGLMVAGGLPTLIPHSHAGGSSTASTAAVARSHWWHWVCWGLGHGMVGRTVPLLSPLCGWPGAGAERFCFPVLDVVL